MTIFISQKKHTFIKQIGINKNNFMIDDNQIAPLNTAFSMPNCAWYPLRTCPSDGKLTSFGLWILQRQSRLKSPGALHLFSSNHSVSSIQTECFYVKKKWNTENILRTEALPWHTPLMRNSHFILGPMNLSHPCRSFQVKPPKCVNTVSTSWMEAAFDIWDICNLYKTFISNTISIRYDNHN